MFCSTDRQFSLCKLRSTLTELTNEVRTLGEDTLDQSPRLTTARGIPVVAGSSQLSCVLGCGLFRLRR